MLMIHIVIVMLNIKCNHTEAYTNSIATFIKREFPVLVQPKDAALLDLLTEAIVGTGQGAEQFLADEEIPQG